MKLDGKVAIVTGGAMGIGRGIVNVFLKYGAKVIILDSSDSLKDTILELNKKYPGMINGFIVDIRKQSVLDAVLSEVKNAYGNVDILVNNAGVCKLASFNEMSEEVRNLHFDINIVGTWMVTHTFLPLLKEGSVIVNLSSVTGPMVADPGEVAYATSKAAILGFTKSLAAELAKKQIRVNAIMPGYVNTPMVLGMAKETNPIEPNSVIEGIADAIPMGRLAEPEEIGELAAFLASREASYITGQGIVIDGGSTLPETMTMGV